jgi:hypothetical protein
VSAEVTSSASGSARLTTTIAMATAMTRKGASCREVTRGHPANRMPKLAPAVAARSLGPRNLRLFLDLRTVDLNLACSPCECGQPAVGSCIGQRPALPPGCGEFAGSRPVTAVAVFKAGARDLRVGLARGQSAPFILRSHEPHARAYGTRESVERLARSDTLDPRLARDPTAGSSPKEALWLKSGNTGLFT